MRTVHLLFLLIFSIHSNVQASRLYLPLSPEVIGAVVESYNALTPEERSEYVRSILKKNDEAFYVKHEKQLSAVTWPDLKADATEVAFVGDGQRVSLKIEDTNQISINGRKIQIRKAQFTTAFQAIVDTLETPKTTFLNLFISEAHAIWPAVVLALIAIALAALVLYPAVSVVKNGILRLKCFEIRSEMGDVNPGSITASQASEMKSKITKLMGDIEADLRETNCRTEASVCRELQQNRSCYQQVLGEINEIYPDQINTSGREEGFIERWTPSFLKPRGTRIRGE